MLSQPDTALVQQLLETQAEMAPLTAAEAAGSLGSPLSLTGADFPHF